MCEANFSYSMHSGINIKPHFITIDISNIQTASNEIAKLIDSRKMFKFLHLIQKSITLLN